MHSTWLNLRHYILCWNLDEILAVATHYDKSLEGFYTPQEIEQWCDQFGGIIPYLIPGLQTVVLQAKLEQRNVIAWVKPEVCSDPGAGIEKMT